MTKRRTYTKEFRVEAVELAETRETEFFRTTNTAALVASNRRLAL